VSTLTEEKSDEWMKVGLMRVGKWREGYIGSGRRSWRSVMRKKRRRGSAPKWKKNVIRCVACREEVELEEDEP